MSRLNPATDSHENMQTSSEGEEQLLTFLTSDPEEAILIKTKAMCMLIYEIPRPL
jgi:hypothetical protein